MSFEQLLSLLWQRIVSYSDADYKKPLVQSELKTSLDNLLNTYKTQEELSGLINVLLSAKMSDVSAEANHFFSRLMRQSKIYDRCSQALSDTLLSEALLRIDQILKKELSIETARFFRNNIDLLYLLKIQKIEHFEKANAFFKAFCEKIFARNPIPDAAKLAMMLYCFDFFMHCHNRTLSAYMASHLSCLLNEVVSYIANDKISVLNSECSRVLSSVTGTEYLYFFLLQEKIQLSDATYSYLLKKAPNLKWNIFKAIEEKLTGEKEEEDKNLLSKALRKEDPLGRLFLGKRSFFSGSTDQEILRQLSMKLNWYSSTQHSSFFRSEPNRFPNQSIQDSSGLGRDSYEYNL